MASNTLGNFSRKILEVEIYLDLDLGPPRNIEIHLSISIFQPRKKFFPLDLEIEVEGQKNCPSFRSLTDTLFFKNEQVTGYSLISMYS